MGTGPMAVTMTVDVAVMLVMMMVVLEALGFGGGRRKAGQGQCSSGEAGKGERAEHGGLLRMGAVRRVSSHPVAR